MPPNNTIGFAAADWILAFLCVLFLLAALAWRRPVQQAFKALAYRTRRSLLVLFLLPIVLRLLLLAHHPVPAPDIYDEFSHLLVADTLLHGRLANPPHPMHRFFETFFVLQQPTYSSIYTIGQGLVLAIGRVLGGVPWTGVLLMSGALSAACYWMLLAWVAPEWAFLGGMLAVAEFGPLCLWTNSYWGGTLAATGGCLVFGCLPRLRRSFSVPTALLLGVGFTMHMVTRPFETVLLALSIAVYLLPLLLRVGKRTSVVRSLALAGIPVTVGLLLIVLQNKAVTTSWTTLPEELSQYQYGVPTSLTFQANPTPHVPLTPQQALDFKAQALTHGTGDTPTKFLLRLVYRIRYYRFFFLPPLYLALVAFLSTLRNREMQFVAITLAIFALGTNLFPYLLSHYLAAVTCLFILASISGLQQLSRIQISKAPVGPDIVRVLVILCFGEFLSWYALHLFESPELFPIMRYETWDSINHDNSRRRVNVYRSLAALPGKMLVFVRYSPNHIYQNEWVWNSADIDNSRIVFARDLGPAEDESLIRYYPDRKVFLLEPDFSVPELKAYTQ